VVEESGSWRKGVKDRVGVERGGDIQLEQGQVVTCGDAAAAVVLFNFVVISAYGWEEFVSAWDLLI
jgi:hypothetical protein